MMLEPQGLVPVRSHFGGVALWLVDLSAYPLERSSGCLSAAETGRAERFRFLDDRRRYCASHCALREVVGRSLGRDPGSLVFLEGEYGKPLLSVGSEGIPMGFHFNLSHCGDTALIGIADGHQIGVDIECLRELDDIDLLAEQHFTEEEQAELAATPRHARIPAFLHCWTRKEACLKAVGCGLTVPPRTFHVGLSPITATVRLEAGASSVDVRVNTVDVGNAAVAAVACLHP